MRKFLLGISVLISLVFLAACGGDGSSGTSGSDGTGTTGTTGSTGDTGTTGTTGSTGDTGTTGTTGDTGDTGTTGTVSVPDADSDLTLTLIRADLDSGKAEFQGEIRVSGLDNLTAESRVSYYVYKGTSSTAKQGLLTEATAVTTIPAYATSGVINSKVKASDNLTLTFIANSAIATETITHTIVCPGNAGGDAATCATLAVSDRIAGGTETATTASFVDNTTSIAYGNGAFQVLSDNQTGPDNATTLAKRGEDPNTLASAIGLFVDNASKTNAYAAATSLNFDNVSAAVALDKMAITSNVIFMGNDAYFAVGDNGTSNAAATGSDNLTIYKRTDGKGDWAILTEDNASTTIDNVSFIQIGSDGTDLFVIHDNGSNGESDGAGLQGHVYLDNGTLVSSGVGSDTSVDTITFCSVATTDKMVIVVDNGSNPGGFDVYEMADNASITSKATDSTIGNIGAISYCDLTLSGTTYILTLLEDGTDNVTVLTSDNLTGWDELYEVEVTATANRVSTVAPNGTADVWVGVSDATNFNLWHSDNGTTGGLIKVMPAMTGIAGSIAHDGGASGSAIIGIAVDNGADIDVEMYYE